MTAEDLIKFLEQFRGNGMWVTTIGCHTLNEPSISMTAIKPLTKEQQDENIRASKNRQLGNFWGI